jgi:hypothetical protein
MFDYPKDVLSKIKNQQEPAGNIANGIPTAATAARPPNILYLLLDQWRPMVPLPLNVPFLRDMGQQSTRFFTQAYVPSPFCAPSRAEIEKS